LFDGHSGNAYAFHSCDPASIPGIGIRDGYMVTRLDRRVFPRYCSFITSKKTTNV